MNTRRLSYLAIVFAVSFGKIAVSSQSHPNTQYFPEYSFFEDAKRDRSDRAIYSYYLRLFEEPSIYGKSGEHVSYFRFLWLRSFHPAITIRVEIQSEITGTLHFKELKQEEPNSTPEFSHKSRKLNREQIRKLTLLFDEISTCIRRTPAPPGLDGSTWVVEYRVGEKYCAVDRWSPESGPIRKFGLYMLKLAGFKGTKDDPIY